MLFGRLPLDEAEGAILAHSVRTAGIAFSKGRILSAADITALKARGLSEVVAARLGPGDVGEDEAAARIAAAIAGPDLDQGAPFTGRVNLFATHRGLLVIDTDRLDRLNLLDEAITVATLPAFAPVEPRQMVATVKIIPFAASETSVAAAEGLGRDGPPPLRVAPFRPLRVGLIQTHLPGTKPSVLDKTVAVTRDRVEALTGSLAADLRGPHDERAVAELVGRLAGTDMILVVGASAITDRRDVLPRGIEEAGGTVEHFGMPVDPGNLLLLARLGETPVLGLPGCARSPKLNGFDWVLQRLFAGLSVSRSDVMRLGIGGLLAEIPSRPLPRTGAAASSAPAAPRIAALVLAAGRSTRMGPSNKLLARVDGVPMVARAVDAALASRAAPVLVVTGHERDRVEAALAGRPVRFVHNPAYGEGLSSSLKAGIAALPPDVDGVLVCLGDMPRTSPAVLDRLIAAYAPAEGRAICVPTVDGRRGNPVLWDRRFLPEILDLKGDVGARHLIGAHADRVCEVAVEETGILLDVDTPEALAEIDGDPAPSG